MVFSGVHWIFVFLVSPAEARVGKTKLYLVCLWMWSCVSLSEFCLLTLYFPLFSPVPYLFSLAPLLSLFLCPVISFKRWHAIALQFFITASFVININPYVQTCMQRNIKRAKRVQQELITTLQRMEGRNNYIQYSYNVGYSFMPLPLQDMRCVFNITA